MENLNQKLTQLKASGLGAASAVQQLKSSDISAFESQSTKSVTPYAGAAYLAAVVSVVFSEEMTPLLLAQVLKIYKDDVNFVAAGIMSPDGYPNTTAYELGKLLLDPTLYPALTRDQMYTVLVTVNFSAADANAAVARLYPAVSYAANISGQPTFLSAPNNSAYNFGTDDFTLQCWVKTTASGTVISRKPTAGGSGNGGFLLVIKNNGVVKFATDHGFGFYEVNTSSPTVVRDGNWHFITAVRKSHSLSIYIDGNPVGVTIGNNVNPPINVSNNLALRIGGVEQSQEPYNQFNGQLDEIRIWNIALDQAAIQSKMNQPLAGNEPGLVGYFNFSAQNGTDSSPVHNNASPTGNITYVTPGVFR